MLATAQLLCWEQLLHLPCKRSTNMLISAIYLFPNQHEKTQQNLTEWFTIYIMLYPLTMDCQMRKRNKIYHVVYKLRAPKTLRPVLLSHSQMAPPVTKTQLVFTGSGQPSMNPKRFSGDSEAKITDCQVA